MMCALTFLRQLQPLFYVSRVDRLARFSKKKARNFSQQFAKLVALYMTACPRVRHGLHIKNMKWIEITNQLKPDRVGIDHSLQNLLSSLF